MDAISVRAQELKTKFLNAIDADTDAFNQIASASRMPKDNEENTALRAKAMEDAQKAATLVPFQVVKMAAEAIELAEQVADKGNPNTLSDAGVAGLTARAAGDAALYNVLINLPGIADSNFVSETKSEALKTAQSLRDRANALHEKVLAQLERA